MEQKQDLGILIRLLARYYTVDKKRLLKNLTSKFDLEELKTLCFDLDVDFEVLGGEGKEGKARELILFMERQDRLIELVILVLRKRPKLSPRSAFLDVPIMTRRRPRKE
jgi:hypothetical protein